MAWLVLQTPWNVDHLLQLLDAVEAGQISALFCLRHLYLLVRSVSMDGDDVAMARFADPRQRCVLIEPVVVRINKLLRFQIIWGFQSHAIFSILAVENGSQGTKFVAVVNWVILRWVGFAYDLS